MNKGLLVLQCWLLAIGCEAAEPERRRATVESDSGRYVISEADIEARIEGLQSGSIIAFSESTFALLDYRGKQVLVIGTDGRVIARLGRPGGGPGELLFPQRLVGMLSGIGVVDGGKNALVVFSLRGDPPRQLPLDSLIGTTSTRLTGMTQLTDSSWVFSTLSASAQSQTERLVRRSPGHSVVLDSTPTATSRAVQYPCGVTVEAAGPPVFWPTLRWSSVSGRTYSAGTDAYVIRRSGGAAIRLPVAARPATEREALSGSLGGSVRTPGASCILSPESALKQRTMAPTVPVVTRLVAAPSGALWVLRTSPPGAKPLVDVFAPDGSLVRSSASAVFPAVFLTDSTFLAADSSSDDVVLRLYRRPK